MTFLLTSNRSMTIKVPSKLILFGEHSVLKGFKCLVVSVNLFGRLKIQNSNCTLLTVTGNDGKIMNLPSILKYETMKSINIDLDIRIGCGLGSSAVISVILSKFIHENPHLISQEYKYLLKNNQINIKEKNSKFVDPVLATALNIENIFHGKSSGVDVTASFVTGFISYQNYKYEKLPIDWTKKYKIIIFDSGINKNTKLVIEKTKTISENYPDIYYKMGDIAEKAQILFSRDFKLQELYILIRKNQELLEKLDVVPEIMKSEVKRLRTFGIESKLTGAGCGGYLFTIVERDFYLENWKEVNISQIN